MTDNKNCWLDKQPSKLISDAGRPETKLESACGYLEGLLALSYDMIIDLDRKLKILHQNNIVEDTKDEDTSAAVIVPSSILLERLLGLEYKIEKLNNLIRTIDKKLLI